MKKKSNISLKYLLIVTLVLALVQSIFLEFVMTDYAHDLFSKYFVLELSLLVLLVFGFNKKWFSFALSIILSIELFLFFLNDLPVSPDNGIMILIFCIRLYVIYRLLMTRTATDKLIT